VEEVKGDRLVLHCEKPGNANLLIGGGGHATDANQEIGVPEGNKNRRRDAGATGPGDLLVVARIDTVETMTKFQRDRLRFAALIVFVSLVFAGPALGQEPGQGTIRVNVNLVLIDTTVKAKDGQIMTGLKKDDFEVREDGVVQKLDVFSRDELPLDVALVLDLSDSIDPFLAPLRDASTVALAALKANDEVALFTFSTEAELRLPLTKDKNKIADLINTFEARGATNINDGIFKAAEYFLKTPPTGRRVIILISDDVGTDAGGQGTNDIVTELIAADAVVYNLKIPGYNPPGTMLHSAMTPGLVNIPKVMEATGGELFNVQDVAHLDTVFSALIQRLKTRYTLGYYTNATGGEGKPHKLEVRLSPSFGKKGKDYSLLAKGSYYIH
jgi:Ca-activated chloride channel family protein